MARYSIRGVQYGADYETEICQVGSSYEQVIEALNQKTLMVHNGKPSRRRTRMPKYSSIRAVEIPEKV